MKQNEDVARLFESLILAAFGDLFKEFSFRHIGTEVQAPECWSTFENSSTRIVITFELGMGPWVEVGSRSRRFLLGERERLDLALLVAERAPHEHIGRVIVPSLEDPRLPSELERLAAQLRKHALDVLRGDFAFVRSVRRRIQH